MTREVNTILNQSARRWTWRRWTLRYRVNLIKIMSKQSKLIIWLANALNVNNLRVTVYLPSWRQISFGVGKEYKEQSSIYVDAPDSDSDIISIIWSSGVLRTYVNDWLSQSQCAHNVMFFVVCPIILFHGQEMFIFSPHYHRHHLSPFQSTVLLWH